VALCESEHLERSAVSGASPQMGKKWRRADTNVAAIKFDQLKKPSNMHTGDPVNCQKCHAMISHLSSVKEDGDENVSLYCRLFIRFLSSFHTDQRRWAIAIVLDGIKWQTYLRLPHNFSTYCSLCWTYCTNWAQISNSRYYTILTGVPAWMFTLVRNFVTNFPSASTARRLPTFF